MYLVRFISLGLKVQEQCILKHFVSKCMHLHSMYLFIIYLVCYSILKAARKKKQNQMRPDRKLGGEQKKPTRPVSGNKDKTIRQLLGSLYADREYLEKLLKEEGKT